VSVTLTFPSHVVTAVACTSCHRGLEIECEGLPGFWGHPTYNEFSCPYCGKQNHALTSGAIVSARPVSGVDR